MEVFLREVEEQVEFWRKHRQRIRELKKVMRRNPERCAPDALRGTVEVLKMLEERGEKRWGLSLFGLFGAAEVGEVGMNAEMDAREVHDLLDTLTEYAAWWRVWLYMSSDELTAEGLCERYLSELAGKPARRAFVIYCMRQEAIRNGKPELVSDTWLAEMLVGCVAARVKLSGERRDRKGLSGRLAEAGNEPGRQLLEELPPEVLDVFHKLGRAGHVDPDLQNLANEALRRIRRVGAESSIAEERQSSAEPQEIDTMHGSGEDSAFEAAFAAEHLQELKSRANVSDQQWDTVRGFSDLSIE